MCSVCPVPALTPLFFPHIAGSGPSDKFTALLRAAPPLGSLSQPTLRLIQAVSRSQYCAQVGRDRAGKGWGGIGVGWGVVMWQCSYHPQCPLLAAMGPPIAFILGVVQILV